MTITKFGPPNLANFKQILTFGKQKHFCPPPHTYSRSAHSADRFDGPQDISCKKFFSGDFGPFWPLRKKFGGFGANMSPSPSEGQKSFVIVISSSRTPQSPPPPPPVWHSVGLLLLHGALDSHPLFPSHVASGRCVLSAAAAGAPAGVVSAFAEPSSWCVGAVLVVAGGPPPYPSPTQINTSLIRPSPAGTATAGHEGAKATGCDGAWAGPKRVQRISGGWGGGGVRAWGDRASGAGDGAVTSCAPRTSPSSPRGRRTPSAGALGCSTAP